MRFISDEGIILGVGGGYAGIADSGDLNLLDLLGEKPVRARHTDRGQG